MSRMPVELISLPGDPFAAQPTNENLSSRLLAVRPAAPLRDDDHAAGIGRLGADTFGVTRCR